MKISTRIKLLSLVSIGVFVATGGTLFVATQQLNRELARNEVAGEVFRGVVAVRYFAMEYALFHEKRTIAQWQLRETSLTRLLATPTPFNANEDGGIYANLHRTYQSVGKLFLELVANHVDSKPTRENPALGQELDARLVGQIMSKIQAMVLDSVVLGEHSRASLLASQRWANIAVTVFTSILAFVIAMVLYLVLRSIVWPIERLREGMVTVGGGNLAHRLDLEARDEIGDLARSFDTMAENLKATTVSRSELITSNEALQSEIAVRQQAELRGLAQLERLTLLHRITRAVGSRQDLESIMQVIVGRLEEQLPADFACMCYIDGAKQTLSLAHVGIKSAMIAPELSNPEGGDVKLGEKALSKYLAGELIYEPEFGTSEDPFLKRLTAGGLGSLVMAPLRVDSHIFGALVVARTKTHGFSSGECEFLLQLSEHVALASHQAELMGALQRAYDDLRQSQQAVMQQERLRSLGQMASGIAHDINNALSPVALYTESLLQSEPNLSERTRAYLEIIERSVDDVSHTVSRMREFHRQREPQMTQLPVPIDLMVQQVIDLTRARWSDMAIQRGVAIEMRVELAGDLPMIGGVESEIREALTNLVLNAIDAVANGGTVSVRTRKTEASGALAAAIQVEIQDNGPGMDEETRRRCLEPFFTTKGERGTGLGLAMVYGVAQRHGAEIEIDSAPGKGTTVRLVFPIPAMLPSAVPSHDALIVPSRLHLLLVDDDPILLKSLRDAFEGDGHVVVTANGGKAGIAAFHDALHPFDAVVTDLGMPNIDGRGVAAAIKMASPSTPVILLTGWGQRLLTDNEIPEHVDRVLSKPPKLGDLRAALAILCATRSD